MPTAWELTGHDLPVGDPWTLRLLSQLRQEVVKFEAGKHVHELDDRVHRPWEEAPNRDPFVAVCSCGIKPMGAQFTVNFELPEHAIAAWGKAAEIYALSRPGLSVLYWHQRPMIQRDMINRLGPAGLPVWHVYARCVLSAAP